MARTYILGMAKSPLQVSKGSYEGLADDFARKINPGSSRSLELDFLRLVYSAKELIKKGHEVEAFLMVTTPEIVETVIQWRVKYEVEDSIVNIMHAELNQKEIQILVNEKTRNKSSNTPTAKNKKTNSRADSGRKILEQKLAYQIEKKHGKGELIKTRKKMPYQINWDYCRVLKE